MSEHETPAARALRALQKLDELSPIPGGDFVGSPGTISAGHRRLLLEAEDALGELLGLSCTADDASAFPFYSHNGETCPIHEWLVPSDATELHEAQRKEADR